jgi:putative peptide zinc metalloprotease protein
MSRTGRATLAAVLGAALAWSGPQASLAQEIEVGGGQDNTAVVVNTKDGSTRFRLSFKIFRTNRDVVDQDNAAVAVASCTECTTMAVAFQVVLVFSEPSTLTTDNLALALNIECSECQTLASAYQWVLGTDGVARFTPEGNRAIARIRKALHDLIRSDLSIWEIQSELDRLAEELEAILAEELVAAGPPGTTAQQVDEQGQPVDGTGETGEETGATPTPEGSPAPGTPEPSPTESPSATPAESPTPTAAPSP